MRELAWPAANRRRSHSLGRFPASLPGRFPARLDRVSGPGAVEPSAQDAPLHVKVSVPKETKPGERRVALVPDVAGKLVDAGFEVLVQAGAGAEAHLADDLYAEKGA